MSDKDTMEFYSNYRPALEAGNYEISVEHELDIPESEQSPDRKSRQFSQTQKFIVQGPQFALDQNDIHAVYPPANSQGRFAECLPHIVMNKRVLPWERELPGQDKEKTPWMALLLFDADELHEGDENSDTKTITSTVEDMLQEDAQVFTPRLKKENLSVSDREMKCKSIKIKTTIFQSIVPNLEELKYLAHCRKVHTVHTATSGMKDDGWFSVVIANRFPNPKSAGKDEGRKNIVHLVSLEGFQDHLTNDNCTKEYIRLVSLASWSFVCLPEKGETFKDLTENLVQQAKSNPDNFMLRLQNQFESNKFINQKLKEGYVPLSYHTQTGEDTFAWYRGPFTPIPTAHQSRTEPLHHASAAMIFDAKNGLFDHSLAAAWQIGRSIALADRTFSVALLKMRRESHRQVDMMLERSQSIHHDSSAELKTCLSSNHIKEKFCQLLKSGITQTIGNIPTKEVPDSAEVATPAQIKPTTRIAALQSFHARDDIHNLVKSELEKNHKPVSEWLAHLRLLYNVPFNHLVPDECMLPMESIRFFYIDQNWLDALLDGALSIGIHCSKDAQFHASMNGVIKESAGLNAQKLRCKLRGEPETSSDNDTEVMSGILIRSDLVYGWPGLVIQAFLGKDNLLKTLRMERLSPNVLLCIFQGIPDKLEIKEPPEAFYFGVDEKGKIALRELTKNVGKPIPDEHFKIYDPNNKFSNYLRKGVERVLNIKPESQESGNGLISELEKKLKLKEGLNSADFAIQMVRTPELLRFK